MSPGCGETLPKRHLLLPSLLLLALAVASACSSDGPSEARDVSRPWVEEDVTFAFGQDQLHGVLTRPTSEGPHPAITIISGSVDPSTGARDGVAARYYVDHARKMALNGYAVLRYDPPGVGRSTGELGFESLDERAEEAAAALRYLQSRQDIRPDQVGLWADSQGAWVIEMVAAAHPQDVAFIVAVSGSGVSVADQQIYSIEAQSGAAGFAEEDITRAVLFGRLLIDWQVPDPMYREVNEVDAETLGDGPSTAFMAVVYEAGDLTAAEGLEKGIEILSSVQEEPWAEFLYLRQLVIPQLQSIPPDQVTTFRETAGQSLLSDPKAYLTRVQSPVLAFFGEDDLLQPTERSAALYEEYLTEAGNEDFTIVVIPGVGHSISLSMPAYWDVLSDWLDRRYAE